MFPHIQLMPFRLFVSNYKWSLKLLKNSEEDLHVCFYYLLIIETNTRLAYEIHYYYCWRNNKISKNRHRRKIFCILLAFFMQQWAIFKSLFIFLSYSGDKKQKSLCLLLCLFISLLISATKCFIYFIYARHQDIRHCLCFLLLIPRTHFNLHYLWTFRVRKALFQWLIARFFHVNWEHLS